MRRLLIVAHADDELLFMGGTLHKYREDDWTIVCVTRDIEHGRDPQFVEVCEAIGATPVQLDFEMGWKPHVPSWDMEALRGVLEAICGVDKWDVIYTHNHVGEYGHPQHVLVYQAVKSLGLPITVFGEGHPSVSHREILSDEDREFKKMAVGIYKRKTKAIMAYPFFNVPYERFAEEQS